MSKKLLITSFAILVSAVSNAAVLTFHNSVGGKSQGVSVNYLGNNHSFNAGAMLCDIDGGANFEAYCVDLDHTVSNGNSYAINVKNMSMQGPNGLRAAWLFNTYAGTVDSNVKGAALQLAIWDVVTDNGDGFGAGNLKSSEGGALMTLANSYLSASAGMSGNALWLEAQNHGENHNRNQNLMTAVPEPSSIAAIFVGAAALLRRRRTK